MRFISRVATILLLVVASSQVLAGGTISGKVLHKKKRWVRNTVVYLEGVKGDWKAEDATIDQKGSTFIPKYLAVLQGATVTFANSDPTDHNVYTPDHEKYDLGIKPQGGKLSYTFKDIGVYTQLCKLHPTMLAYVIVLQNPFYAISDKKGNFAIENVPPGKYTLIIWNERYKGDPVEVTVTADGTEEVAIKLHR